MKLGTEHVTSVLKQMVGWGVTRQRLAFCPEFKELAGVPDGTRAVEAGDIIWDWFVAAIDTLPGHEFEGRWYEAGLLNRAFRLLLQIEGTGLSAPNRRYRVITDLLKIYCSDSQWRREFGLERRFLRILAEHLVQNAKVPNLVTT